MQISTDGLNLYVDAVERAFGGAVDFAQVVMDRLLDAALAPEAA